MSRFVAPSFAGNLFWAGCALLGAAACRDSTNSGGTAAGPGLVDLGLAAQSSELAGDGDLWLVAAREFETGGHDLDLDGDALDQVVYVLDLASGTATNTSLALELRASALLANVRGPLAVFAASESSSGNRDLNGDSDTDDAVLYVFDARTGTTHGLGLAVSVTPGFTPAIGGDLVAFAVNEAAQGADLDGDGLRSSDVLHVYDSTTRTLVNTGIDAPSRLFVEDGSVAFFVSESGIDLNGDGDTQDRAVLEVYDAATQTVHVSGLATDGGAPVFADGFWLVGVPEFAAGRDLDGDGDLFDDVLHVFEPATGLVRNLGLPIISSPAAVASLPASGRSLFGLLVAETDGFDRNGDGDLFDRVAELYDPRTDRLVNTAVAAAALPVFSGRIMGFLGSELEQGADLNGDGDLLDSVAFVTVPAGVTTELQEAIDLRAAADGDFLLARRESEATSGLIGGQGIDWNHDGDTDDIVVHVFDPLTRTSINTQIASVDTLGASAHKLLLYVDEAGERRDLNLDGDQLDQVFVLFDLDTLTSTSVGLAGAPDATHFGHLSASGHFTLLASESSEGRDLDGDGDLFDDVVHRAQ